MGASLILLHQRGPFQHVQCGPAGESGLRNLRRTQLVIRAGILKGPRIGSSLFDRVLPMQTGENWQVGMQAKVKGAHNLHRASLQLLDLQYFVLWSSQVTQVGNEGISCNKLPLVDLHPFRRS